MAFLRGQLVGVPGVLAEFVNFTAIDKVFKVFGNPNLGNPGQLPQLFVGGFPMGPDEFNDPVFSVCGVHEECFYSKTSAPNGQLIYWGHTLNRPYPQYMGFYE